MGALQRRRSTGGRSATAGRRGQQPELLRAGRGGKCARGGRSPPGSLLPPAPPPAAAGSSRCCGVLCVTDGVASGCSGGCEGSAADAGTGCSRRGWRWLLSGGAIAGAPGGLLCADAGEPLGARSALPAEESAESGGGGSGCCCCWRWSERTGLAGAAGGAGAGAGGGGGTAPSAVAGEAPRDSTSEGTRSLHTACGDPGASFLLVGASAGSGRGRSAAAAGVDAAAFIAGGRCNDGGAECPGPCISGRPGRDGTARGSAARPNGA